MNKVFLFLFFQSLIFVFAGCLKDDVIPPPEVTFNNSEELVHYLESKGDFINSVANPAIIEASEVYENINNYLLIDIRPEEEFLNGHIENAINVRHENLLSFLGSKEIKANQKIVIISLNGQSSSFYTSLLRIYGYGDVYSMNFGMASWNRAFAIEWLDIINPRTIPLDDLANDKHVFDSLPTLSFSKNSLSAEEKFQERISAIFNEEFDDKYVLLYKNESPSIYPDYLMERDLSKDYVVCYGIELAYGGKASPVKHIQGAVHYNPPFESDFRSSKYLQTLPLDKKIFIYSYDGNLSAFLTAYLRILGYDAVSCLFGMNSFIASGMAAIPELAGYVFSESKIMNYPYVK